ncbi:MAG: hypothetical protein QMB52_09855 [Propionivibrio sp.]
MFKTNQLKILGEYVGHLAVGAVMFTALLVFSGLVKLAVHWTGNIVGDAEFTVVMAIVELVMLYADVVFLVWWALYSTFKAIKEMMSRE